MKIWTTTTKHGVTKNELQEEKINSNLGKRRRGNFAHLPPPPQVGFTLITQKQQIALNVVAQAFCNIQ